MFYRRKGETIQRFKEEKGQTIQWLKEEKGLFFLFLLYAIVLSVLSLL
jgi:hypothetical protein